MLLNKKREKLPCHAVPTIRIFPGDDEFMGCVPGYTRIVIVMRMQQTGRTELSIPVPPKKLASLMNDSKTLC
jgi:hypothetical protein